MHLTEEQWNIIAPIFVSPPRRERRGRPRVPDREVLDGILWILKTGAQWNELPGDYPPYQTCHRRYQEWVERIVFQKVLTLLAQDMEQRGKINLKECFIDGTFSSAKKGGSLLVRLNAGKAVKSWRFRTRALFLSPSIWPLLLRMKSDWWKKRLPGDLPERIRGYSWATGHTIAIH